MRLHVNERFLNIESFSNQSKMQSTNDGLVFGHDCARDLMLIEFCFCFSISSTQWRVVFLSLKCDRSMLERKKKVIMIVLKGREAMKRKNKLMSAWFQAKMLVRDEERNSVELDLQII